MELYFSEECSVIRDYTYDIEPEEFLEWLDGREPNEKNLAKYIQTITPDNVSEDEYTLESNFENAEDFLEECHE